MQKRLAKLESLVKDINDDVNTICEEVDKLTQRVNDINRIIVNMTIEDEEPVENTDYEQLKMNIQKGRERCKI